MRKASVILIFVCCTFIAGCPEQKSGPGTGQPISSSAAPQPSLAPQSLTEAQIESTVNAKLSLLNQAITWRTCSGGPQPTNPPSAGVPGISNSDGQSNYSAWLHYVANHIATETAFGSDYEPIALSALKGFSQLSPTSDACMAANTKDVDLQQAFMQTTPDSVGKYLFGTFSPYDQTTRQLVAQYLVKQ
jgi:hypothetical protein